MKTILAVCLLLASALDARAGEMLVPSVESSTDTSPSIGIYTAAAIIGKPGNYHTVFSPNLKLVGPLKGNPPAILKSDAPRYADMDLPVDPGERFLVFFRVYGSAPSESLGPLGSLGPERIINLTHPGDVRGSPEPPVFNAKFEALTDGDAILRTVRARMAAHPGTFPAQHAPTPLEISQSQAFERIGRDGDDPYCLMVPGDLQTALVARYDLEMIIGGLNGYYHMRHAMPSGGPAKIVKTLCDADWLSKDALKAGTNAAGEFLDPWGTPYRIDVSNPKFPRAWSCGPDKKDSGGAPGSDDVISW